VKWCYMLLEGLQLEGMESVNDSYYLTTLEGRRRPLPISGRLLKPHQGGGT
jgi:hypothetical protein